MFRKKATTAQPHSDIEQLRETIREMEARSHELSNQLLNFDWRSQPSEETLTAQRDLTFTRDLIATLSGQLKELEAEQAQEHAKAGLECAIEYAMKRTALLNQRAAQLAAIAATDEKSASLQAAAQVALAPWPEHLHKYMAKVPYHDDVTRLAEALIMLRRELLRHGDIFGFFERSGLSAPWFRVEIGKREDWARLDLAEIESWLARYRQRAM